MLVSESICRIWLIVAFSLSLHLVQTDHILTILSYGSGAPYIWLRPFVKALVDRSHEMTVISAVNHFPTIDGVHHIRVPELDHILAEMPDYTFDTTPNKWLEAIWLSKYFYYTSSHILSNPEVQQLFVNKSAQFDLIILDTPHSDALCGFAKHFNAPMIGIAAFGPAWIVDYLAGNPVPSTFHPTSPIGYSFESLSLWNKWRNWIHIIEEWLLERLVYLPAQIKLYRQYFYNSYSNFHEMRRNFSLILLNHHFSLGRVRSNVPNLIEVAGMHLCLQKQCKLNPISKDLQRFLDEAEHGVIYFSIGIEILVKWLPNNVLETLFKTFSSLKQRVIWKYEDCDSVQNKSNNIFYGSYLPQQQILNHPKVKLFISHAGLLSIIETTYYGVPILSLPLFYDQFANAQRMRVAGMGQTLELNSINVQTFNQTIQELLQNPFYKKNAQRKSIQFRDQPMNPLETAVWWTEYILRHKSGSHMRIAEHDTSFMQYYNIDLVFILFGRIGLPVTVVFLLVYKLTYWVAYRSHLFLRIT